MAKRDHDPAVGDVSDEVDEPEENEEHHHGVALEPDEIEGEARADKFAGGLRTVRDAGL
jgi:hypothetical protein